jgi:hypothetical protein
MDTDRSISFTSLRQVNEQLINHSVHVSGPSPRERSRGTPRTLSLSPVGDAGHRVIAPALKLPNPAPNLAPKVADIALKITDQAVVVTELAFERIY